jgi:hypothetical protein
LVTILNELQLAHHVERFRDEAIDWKLATELSDDDLRTIGVSKLGERRQILRAIRHQKLRPEVQSSLAEWQRVARKWFLQTKSSLEENLEKRLKQGLAQITVLEIIKVGACQANKRRGKSMECVRFIRLLTFSMKQRNRDQWLKWKVLPIMRNF